MLLRIAQLEGELARMQVRNTAFAPELTPAVVPEAEQTLRLQAQLLEQLHDSVICTDMQGRITFWNGGAQRLYGYEAAEVLGCNISILYAPEEQEFLVQRVVAPLLSQGKYELEVRPLHRDGRRLDVLLSLSLLYDADGLVTGMVGLGLDVSARKRAEEQLHLLNEQLEARVEERTRELVALNLRLRQEIQDRQRAEESLRESEHCLRQLSDNLPGGFLCTYSYDAQGHFRFEYVGAGAEQLLGVSAAEALADPSSLASQFAPEMRQNLQAAEASSREAMAPLVFELRQQHRSTGEWGWAMLRATPSRRPDGSIIWYAVYIDISERKQIEQQLRTTLQEKELLLREIHHRVKNNLQVVISMLRMQARTLDAPQAHSALTECCNRVRSMAMVHEHLYQSRDLSHIDLAGYLSILARRVVATCDNCRIDLKCNLEPVIANIDLAVPLGLVANELLTNAYKHGFPNGQGGYVRLELAGVAEKRYRLTVEDNGIALPAGMRIERRAMFSLGLRLVLLLAQQLEASFEIEAGSPKRFSLVFRI